MTVEIGYALLSAAFAAAVVFGAVAGPALLFALPDPVERALLPCAAVVAVVLFAVRVVSVLVRFHQGGGTRPGGPGRTGPAA